MDEPQSKQSLLNRFAIFVEKPFVTLLSKVDDELKSFAVNDCGTKLDWFVVFCCLFVMGLDLILHQVSFFLIPLMALFALFLIELGSVARGLYPQLIKTPKHKPPTDDDSPPDEPQS